MASFTINCPFCAQLLTVEDSWSGMKTICPICNREFIVPFPNTPTPAAAPHTVQKQRPSLSIKQNVNESYPEEAPDYYYDGYESYEEPKESIFVKIINAAEGYLVIILFSAAIVFYITKCDSGTSSTPASSPTNHTAERRSVENGEMEKWLRELFDDNGIKVESISFPKYDEKLATHYGKVTYTRKGGRYTRPVIIKYTSTKYEYGMDFKYTENRDYLLEDADFFFYSLKNSNPNELSEYNFVGASYHSPGVVICTIRSNNGDTEKVKITVSHGVNDIIYRMEAYED